MNAQEVIRRGHVTVLEAVGDLPEDIGTGREYAALVGARHSRPPGRL